jgi:chromosome segregation ATPase
MKGREEIKKYEAKIADLHSQVEKEAKGLSETQSRHEILKSEIVQSNKALASLSRQAEKKQIELASLDEQIERKEKIRTEVLSYQQERKDRITKDIESIARQKAPLLAFIAKKKQDLKLIERKEASARKSFQKIERQIQALEAKVKGAKLLISSAQKVGRDLEAKDIEIKEMIVRDSRIRAENEKSLRTIEHYVKRLQRYYDKAGIHIDVLSQFNITRDNK